MGAVAVFGPDLHALMAPGGEGWRAHSQRVVAIGPLPSSMTSGLPPRSGSEPPAGAVAHSQREQMAFVLESDGVLVAAGSIDQGASARLERTLSLFGDAVKTVAIDSPGGSLDDAMAMARTIRQGGLTTEIRDGAVCASSCPLLFAGGAGRLAGPRAVVGVHQFYSASAEFAQPAQAMADTQITIARISRHLAEMGVDPALWLHALDTPPRSLYYLTPEEMSGYRLVTGPQTVAAR